MPSSGAKAHFVLRHGRRRLQSPALALLASRAEAQPLHLTRSKTRAGRSMVRPYRERAVALQESSPSSAARHYGNHGIGVARVLELRITQLARTPGKIYTRRGSAFLSTRCSRALYAVEFQPVTKSRACLEGQFPLEYRNQGPSRSCPPEQ